MSQKVIAITTRQSTLHYPGLDAEFWGQMPYYYRPLMDMGAVPLMVPLELNEEQMKEVLNRVDGVLIPGGGDIQPKQYKGNSQHPTLRDQDPLVDELELAFTRLTLEQDKPWLGICRGHQVLNVVQGGSLWEDIDAEHPDAIRHTFFGEGYPWDEPRHAVTILPNTLLHDLMETDGVMVNSLHHQGIRELGDGLRVNARSADGLVEGTELPDKRFALSVQWHPEHLLEHSDQMLGLFRGLLQAS